MANIRSSGHQIKKRLLEYMDTERYLDSQIERLRTLESKMYSIGSPEITDMPKGSNVIKDRIGTMVAKKEEIENEIGGLIVRQNGERVWVQAILDRMTRCDEKAIIQIRYLDGQSWSKVAEHVYGKRKDFDERKESYIRQCTRIHSRAMQNIIAIVRKNDL